MAKKSSPKIEWYKFDHADSLYGIAKRSRLAFSISVEDTDKSPPRDSEVDEEIRGRYATLVLSALTNSGWLVLEVVPFVRRSEDLCPQDDAMRELANISELLLPSLEVPGIKLAQLSKQMDELLAAVDELRDSLTVEEES